MAKYDQIVIVSDIDGTFLGTGGQLVARNLAAIEAFKREGGRFTFATGRFHLNLARNLPEAMDLPNVPGILANGTCLYDFTEKRVVEAIYIDPQPVIEALRMTARDFPTLGIRVSTTTGLLVPAFEGIVARDLAVLRDITEVKPIETWSGENWYKVVVRGDDALLEMLRAEYDRRWPGAFAMMRSEPGFLELQHAGCSKATLLGRLREYATVDGKMPIIYAVGDYENDYDMLRAADVAVCPTNALPMIREICTISPSTNDDGVIAALIETLH